jgi:PII-like signaling protein
MLKTKLKRMMIFIDETDSWQGGNLAKAVVERLRSEGLRGATVLKGISGFGGSGQVHTASIVDVATDLPLIILAVDEPAKIDQVLPLLDEMIGNGLITVDELDGFTSNSEPVEPIAAHVEHMPHTVHEYMDAQPLSIDPQSDLATAVSVILKNHRTHLAVVNEQKVLLGMLSAQDVLARLVNVPVGPTHLFWLRGDDKQKRRGDFKALHCSDVMRKHPVFVDEDMPMTKAVALMLKENLSAVPVLKGGKLIGILRLPEVLSKALAIEYNQST